jgi:hypothetical protein
VYMKHIPEFWSKSFVRYMYSSNERTYAFRVAFSPLGTNDLTNNASFKSVSWLRLQAPKFSQIFEAQLQVHIIVTFLDAFVSVYSFILSSASSRCLI